MIEIELTNIGKRYHRDWVFRNIDLKIQANSNTVISGSNGSGKSTLLMLLSGFIQPSEGAANYLQEGKLIPQNLLYKKCSIASPMQDLYDEFTLKEALEFHQKFKQIRVDMTPKELAEYIQLPKQLNKTIRSFSSGMKQRLKLALAILSDSSLLLLDEPTSNLDSNGKSWYQKLIQEHLDGRTIFVASNNLQEEHFFCNFELNIEDFK